MKTVYLFLFGKKKRICSWVCLWDFPHQTNFLELQHLESDSLKYDKNYLTQMPELGSGCTGTCQGLDAPTCHFLITNVLLPLPRSQRLAAMFAFPSSAHIPLAVHQSHDHCSLQGRLGNVVFLL